MMSDIQKKAAEGVTDLKSKLKQMPLDMRIFSLSMRSLYSNRAVGSSSEAAQKFRKLRDDTRNDAEVYLQCILPISVKFVSSMNDYFEYYLAVSFDEWVESKEVILENSKTYKDLAQIVLKIHEEMIVHLKKRQDEAKIIMTELKDLQEKYEKQEKELQAKAKTKKIWAFALSFIPYINVIATPVLNALGDVDLVEAIATKEESKVDEAAALVVAECLIPALSSFADGLGKAAGFFQVMEMELESFQENAEKGDQSPKRLYYNIMKAEAEEMKSLCQTFYAVLPEVRTDFQAIPKRGTDQNYVDKWLETKKEEISKSSAVYSLLKEIFSGGN